jgi:16S rRNA (uracil1498-N3)-methyltransferase
VALHDLTSQRLFVAFDLAAGAEVICAAEQAHYLRSVLRMADGAPVLVFNGRDGEWRTRIRHDGKRGVVLHIDERTRPQLDGPDIDYLFAPLKRSRLDYMVQKATEMGVRRLLPVITRRTIAERVNGERMRANAMEAAEQCGVLRVPEVEAPRKLDDVLAGWDAKRRIIFCDEETAQDNPIDILRAVPRGPLAVLIGPEGGFASEERIGLQAKSFVTAISLGPRIMRADTAAVAALALVNATLGDWG